jgi:hypothetical protein
LNSEDAETLRLAFEKAGQLGVFGGSRKKLSWTEKLWTLAVYWDLQDPPCTYGDLADKPYILDMHVVVPRLTIEVRNMHAQQERL